MGEIKNNETTETKTPETNMYKDIKPESNITPKEAKEFWEDKFSDTKVDDVDQSENVEELVQDYFDKIKEYSDCPETIPDKPFDAKDLKKLEATETRALREEFNNKSFKDKLISEWEQANGRDWPRYKEDVYVQSKATGEMIKLREAGQRYDAHHIQPLSMGGKNEASNLTPLRADVHEDHRGVHAKEGVYGRIEQTVGGN